MTARARAGRRLRKGRDGGEDHASFFFDEIRPDDTYLVSFPRSGNTYLRHLVASLVLDRSPTADEVQDLVPDVHWCRAPVRPDRPVPLVAKSHAPVRDVPAKIVYLVRDGRAALLSYYRYLHQRGQPAPPAPDAMLGWPDVWPCPWEEHVSGWLRYLGGRDRALVVRYEDLVSAPGDVLRRVAGLAGVECTDLAAARAVERSAAHLMRATERAGAPGSLNFVATPGPGWRESLGAQALRQFEERCGALLRTLGYPVDVA